MRVCVIKNEYYNNVVGYLIYYQKNKTFYIELLDGNNLLGMPIIFKHFYDLGKKTIDAYWSRKWVSERIVPLERQNIASIIRDNNLKGYDEYKMLLLCHGRCSQDDCYIEEIEVDDLPNEIRERFDKKLTDCMIATSEMLIFFRNGEIRKISIQNLTKIDEKMTSVINKKNLLSEFEITPGGYGLEFVSNIYLSSEELYQESKGIGITFDDLKKYITERVVNTLEATEILDCSRQNINDLVKRNKIKPIKKTLKCQLFLRTELENK